MSTSKKDRPEYPSAPAKAVALLACLLMGVLSIGTPVNAQDAVEAEDAKPAVLELDSSTIPQRPPAHFLDQARWFSLAEKEQTAKELERIYQEQKIDLYIVTRKQQPPQGAANYARALGKAWARSPVWCVIFQVPGDPEGFHVQAGITEVKPELVAAVMAKASKTAKRESTEKERVMVAWRDCALELRFLYAQIKRYNEKQAEQWEEMRQQWIAEHRRKKILKVVVLGAGVVLLVVIIWVVIMVRRKRALKAFEFPETSWRKRYQAPHSGGGGIVARSRVSRSRD